MKELIDMFVSQSTEILTSLGPLAGVFLIMLESIIPVLPLSVFITLNIMSYGSLLGFFISYFATVVGCTCSFFLFRYLFQKWLYKFTKKKNLKKIENLMNSITKISFQNLTLLMALPFTPAFLLNVASGLSRISFKKFALSLLVGKGFMIYFWGYVGTSLLESLTDITILFRIAIMLVIAYIMSKWISKKTNIS